MKTPTAPQSGAPVTANWGREVCDALRRMRLQAGPGIRLSQTPEGTTISAARAPVTPPAVAFPYGPRWAFGIEFYSATVEEVEQPHVRIHNIVTRTGQIYATGGPLTALLGTAFDGLLFLVVDWDQYPDGETLFSLLPVAEDPLDPGVIDPREVVAAYLDTSNQELVPLYWVSGSDFAVDYIHGAHSGHGWIPTDFPPPEEP